MVRRSIQALDMALPTFSSKLLLNHFTRARRRKDTYYKAHLPAGAQSITIQHHQQALVGWTWGDKGPHILLVHGWEGHAGQMLPMVIPLLHQGFRVTVFDMPGHGLSPKTTTDLMDIGKAVLHTIEQLGPFESIVAHSGGAAATVIMLANEPQAAPQKLVLLSPMRDLEQHFSIFTELAGLSGTRKARLRALVTRRIGLPMEACSAIKAAARLTIPGLIIHDHTDIVVPHENAVELAAQWRGSTLIETWGLGHRMGLKDAGVIKEIITFLKEDEALLAT
jgi:pimeloyl-ACP methyl ester carboxylesterase